MTASPRYFPATVKPQWFTIIVSIGMLALFTVAYVRTAWIAEDAFITFRTIDNALNGLGLTWNYGERVQTYTHPLWLATLLPAVGIFGDPYYTTLVLSYALLMLTLFVVGTTIPHWNVPAVVAVVALLWSRAFIDYSSSGLENPLTHAVLATYLWVWVNVGRRRAMALMGMASALFLARPDAVILIMPSLVVELWQQRRNLRPCISSMLLGALPAIAWVAFSLFYYGAPVPNTALAKVQTGISLSQNAMAAWQYIKWTAEKDTVTLILLMVGMAWGLIGRSNPLRPFAVGLLAWVAYLFYIGADYMGGRFFSAPVLVATIIFAIGMSRSRTRIWTWLTVLVLSFHAGVLGTTLLSPSDYEQKDIPPSGVADERGFYYTELGMLRVLERGDWFSHRWLSEGAILRANPGLYVQCAIGMIGYAAGPQVYLLDPLALADPFLARVPARKNSRVGHYERALLPGYIDTLRSGTNLLPDPRLRALYDDVFLATRAPLNAPGRLHAIWRLNTGHHLNARSVFEAKAVGLPRACN